MVQINTNKNILDNLELQHVSNKLKNKTNKSITKQNIQPKTLHMTWCLP